jgi:hypothetical protein
MKLLYANAYKTEVIALPSFGVSSSNVGHRHETLKALKVCHLEKR